MKDMPILDERIEEVVAKWIDTHYRPDRLEGHRDGIIADRVTDLRRHGQALISHHDTIMGGVSKLRITSHGDFESSGSGRTCIYYW